VFLTAREKHKQNLIRSVSRKRAVWKVPAPQFCPVACARLKFSTTVWSDFQSRHRYWLLYIAEMIVSVVLQRETFTSNCFMESSLFGSKVLIDKNCYCLIIGLSKVLHTLHFFMLHAPDPHILTLVV